ncbi:MAG: hypothetical protein ACE361_07060 [Aureliella sp.]
MNMLPAAVLTTMIRITGYHRKTSFNSTVVTVFAASVLSMLRASGTRLPHTQKPARL